MRFELVTRAGCHLCEEALATLRAAGIEPDLRDVDSEPGLLSAYDWRVPVLLVDGEPVGEGRFDASALARIAPRATP